LREPLAVKSPALKEAEHKDHHNSTKPFTVAITAFGHHLAWSVRLRQEPAVWLHLLQWMRRCIAEPTCLDRSLCEPVIHCECYMN